MEAGCHTVFIELGEQRAERFSGIHNALLRAGFDEAYESHTWQRPALHPAEAPEHTWH
jgi:hypothetical protein